VHGRNEAQVRRGADCGLMGIHEGTPLIASALAGLATSKQSSKSRTDNTRVCVTLARREPRIRLSKSVLRFFFAFVVRKGTCHISGAQSRSPRHAPKRPAARRDARSRGSERVREEQHAPRGDHAALAHGLGARARGLHVSAPRRLRLEHAGLVPCVDR
jgi:hypothetical protein